MLSTRSDLEVQMLIMLYGLDGENPKSLYEINLNHGITRERVRQILSKLGSYMRLPNNSQEIRQYLEDGLDKGRPVTSSLPDLVTGATNIRTGRMVAHANPKPLQKTRDPALEPWQVYPDEPWDLPEQRTVEV